MLSLFGRNLRSNRKLNTENVENATLNCKLKGHNNSHFEVEG